MNFLNWDDFEAVLAIFCSYGYGASSSEEVEKIATGEIIKNVSCDT